jgi:uncharacterized integral membrane protein
MKAKIIILLILIVLFTIFVSQNTRIVQIDFLFWSVAMSAIVLISLMMLIGVIAGFIMAKMFDRPSKSQVSISGKDQPTNPKQ